jgi:HlyD family secretion protein
MNHKRPSILTVILILLVVLAILAGGYLILRALPLQKTAVSALTASGTIETVEVTVAPEIGGKVADVLVEEGASIKKGDVLFRLDDTLLQAQSAVAVANLNAAQAAVTTANAALATAQAQYALAVNAAQTEAAASRTSSWIEDNPAGYTLPGWFFGKTEAIASTQSEVDSARSALAAAQTKLDGLENDSSAASYLAVEKRLNEARTAFILADAVLTRAKDARDNTDLELAAQKRYDSAKTDLDNAQSDYDDLADHDVAKNILTARAELAVAQERYDTAQDRLLALQIGDQSPKLAVAQAALNQAKASADQAALAVTQAQANLALLNAQLDKLTVKAPSDGVILTRSIEPGEVLPVGASAFTLGRLDNLTITVYIPEDRYGEVKLNQTASVAVDPFPGETFNATVIHIAGQAEYTPRNVQTVSGRKSTVFAIKLQVEDPNNKLKPGMPADVVFK